MTRQQIALSIGVCVVLFTASWLLHRSLTTPPAATPYSETSEGILASAEKAFDSREFKLAIPIYERYLRMKPDDLQARSSYGITLMFSGQPDRAVKELEGVVTRDPSNFHAGIYLALALSEKGDYVRARQKAAETMQSAPTEEARKRIGEFMESLKNPY